MAVEGIHTSLQRSSLGALEAPNPFQTPLDANSVFTLASQIIVSCLPSHPTLPVTAFPGLNVSSQPCFNEVGSGSSGRYSTESNNYATVVSDMESSSDTTNAYYSQVTDSTINAYTTSDSTTAAYTTTTTMYISTTIESSAAYTTTITMDMSMVDKKWKQPPPAPPRTQQPPCIPLFQPIRSVAV